MRVIFYLLVALFTSLVTQAQNNVVEYSKDFEFTEGVYLSFNDFVHNKPLEKLKIITELNKEDIDFMRQVTSRNSFKYLDSIGKEQSVETDKLWGYSKNNGVFIYYAKDFYRLSLIGTLCHFTATIIQYVGVPGYGYGFGIGGMGMGSRSTVTQELRQFILDTRSGTISDFNVSNMEIILQTDKMLEAEFKALKKKEKRESIFLYLRKYNQHHPLYFPVN